MYQLILFNKTNKNVMSEKKMDHFISQTKHILSFYTSAAANHFSELIVFYAVGWTTFCFASEGIP
jgi:hypothetical protein